MLLYVSFCRFHTFEILHWTICKGARTAREKFQLDVNVPPFPVNDAPSVGQEAHRVFEGRH